jgi:hypothetical protein
MGMNFWQGILTVLKSLVTDIENALAQVGKEIWHIIEAVFTAEESAIMAEFYLLMKQVAVDLQNKQPGMSAKDFFAELEGEATKILAEMGKTLAWTAIATTISTVLHDLGVADSGGNAGDLSAGVQQ